MRSEYLAEDKTTLLWTTHRTSPYQDHPLDSTIVLDIEGEDVQEWDTDKSKDIESLKRVHVTIHMNKETHGHVGTREDLDDVVDSHETTEIVGFSAVMQKSLRTTWTGGEKRE